MMVEFVKEHKKICIIILLIIIVVLLLIFKNKNSSDVDVNEVVSDSVEEVSEEEIYYEEDYLIDNTEELDETQTTRYNDINYGVE